MPFEPVIGRIGAPPNEGAPADTVLIYRRGHTPAGDLSAFAAVLVEGTEPSGPRIGGYNDLSHLEVGDLVLVDGRNGYTRTLYRKSSPHNALFVTERCNNNCLMCSQPPKVDEDDQTSRLLRIINLLRIDPPSRLGITGGEPTLLGDGFLRLLGTLKRDLPETTITTLTNGRLLADLNFANGVADIGHPRFRFTIPLHADVPDVHDYVAQAKGAFNETVAGLYRMAALGIEVEIRVVLHSISVPRLPALAEYVWRKLPFVRQVAFMGLENMGYVKMNWAQLWIDPIEYGDTLRISVEHLWRRGIDASIYNLPFCLLPKDIWGFCRRSISDHKQMLLPECKECEIASSCTGLFTSSKKRHSRGVLPIRLSSGQSLQA